MMRLFSGLVLQNMLQTVPVQCLKSEYRPYLAYSHYRLAGFTSSFIPPRGGRRNVGLDHCSLMPT